MDTSRYPGPTVFQAHSTIYKTTFDQPRVMVANNLPHKSVDATIFIIMGAPKGHDNCFEIPSGIRACLLPQARQAAACWPPGAQLIAATDFSFFSRIS